jgi:hypothetical protein
MMSADELLSHAERCTNLAEWCTDQAVAEKLRQLAQEYCDLAAHTLNRQLPIRPHTGGAPATAKPKSFSVPSKI